MLVGYSVVLGRQVRPSAYRVWPAWKQPKGDRQCKSNTVVRKALEPGVGEHAGTGEERRQSAATTQPLWPAGYGPGLEEAMGVMQLGSALA
jgi:hypothetical protein